MWAFTILVAATGLALGFRFNVFLLGLLLLLATARIVAICIWGADTPGVVAMHLLVTLASVQISYLIGCLIAAQFPKRASRMQTRSLRRLSARGDALTVERGRGSAGYSERLFGRPGGSV